MNLNQVKTYALLSLGVLGIFAFGASEVFAQEVWNDTDWTEYDTITIDHTNIDDDLTDFPVYVDLSDLSVTFWSTTPSASSSVGTDIRVTTGTSSPYEIPRELVFASSTLETGELHFKADLISSTTDTVFRIYYNGTTTGDYASSTTYGAQNVWSDYDAVWHFDEDPSVEQLKDSTANNNNGTTEGAMTSTDLVAGKVGRAISFDEVNDRIAVPDATSLNFPNSDWSYSTWIDLTDNAGSNFQYFTSWDTVGATPSFNIYFNETSAGTGPNTLSRALNTNTTRTSGSYGNNSDWQYLNIQRQSGSVRVYVNGVIDSSTQSLTAPIDGDGSFFIGGRNDADSQRYFGGELDNMRLQDRSLSQAWISAEYLNQSEPTDFYRLELPNPVISGEVIDNGSGVIGLKVSLAVGTSSNTVSVFSTTTTAEGFSFEVDNTSGLEVGDSYLLWIDDEIEKGTLVSNFAEITGTSTRDIIVDRLTVAHSENNEVGTIDLTFYDKDNDSDIIYDYTGAKIIEITAGYDFAINLDTVFKNDTSLSIPGSLFNNGTIVNEAPPITFTGTGKSITSSSSLGDIVIDGSYEFGSNATTSNLTINEGASLQAPNVLNITGNFTNEGSFDPDGGETYFVGGRDFGQISLSHYDSELFDVGSEASYVYGLTFNNDGSKLFVVDWIVDTVYAYDLSVPYDVSTAVYNSESFGVGSQDGNPFGIKFNNLGSRMYIMGNNTNTVYTYSLSTSYDVTTAAFNGQSFGVGSQETSPQSLAFNETGSKMYVIGSATDTVYTYDLSSNFSVTTAAYNSESFSVGSQETSPTGISFKSDGSKMYIVGPDTDTVYAYDLSVPYDVSTAVYNSESFSVTNEEASPFDVAFNSNSSKMYVIGSAADTVYAYETGSVGVHSGDLTFGGVNIDAEVHYFEDSATTSSLTISNGAVLKAPTTTLNVGGNFTQNGSFDSRQGKLIFSGSENTTSGYLTGVNSLNEIKITGNYTFNNNASTSDLTIDTSASMTAPSGGLTIDGVFVNDGSFDANDGTVYLNGEDYYDLTELAYIQSRDISAQEFIAHDLAFNNDGSKMFVVGSAGDDVNEYTLSTAFDVSTASFVDSFSVASEETFPYGLAFNNDGSKMFVVGSFGDGVNEYTLSTAFDVSTASFVDSFSVAGQDNNPQGISFSDDGTKMFILGAQGRDVNEYSLSVAFDVSTASFNDSFGVGFSGLFNGISFSNDGSKMFVLNYTSDTISEYTLSTPFDVSTASFVDNFLFNDRIDSPTGFSFNNDGSKIFVIDELTESIVEYSMSLIHRGGFNFSDLLIERGSHIFTESVVTADLSIGNNTALRAPSSTLEVAGDFINNGNFDANNVDLILSGAAKTIEGSLTGFDTLNNVSVTGEYTFVNNASTSDLNIAPGASLEMPALLTVEGDYTNDGSVDLSGNTLYLGDPFGVTELGYLDVSGQAEVLYDLNFNNDGTKFYVSNPVNATIYAYDLDIAYDINTATYNDESFSVATQEVQLYSFSFNDDGSKIFIVGEFNDTVYSYNLVTNFDISTASYDSEFFDTSSQISSNPLGPTFSSDGSKMFVSALLTSNIYAYDLSTDFDVSSAVYNSENISLASDFPAGMIGPKFSSDGTKMYIMNLATKSIYIYDSDIPYDLNSYLNTGKKLSFDFSDNYFASVGFDFSSDGQKIFVIYTDLLTKSFVHAFSVDEAQSFSGNMLDGSAFNNIIWSGPTSLIFNEPVSVSGSFVSVAEAVTDVTFNAGDTFTFQNFNVNGISSTSKISLISSSPGNEWYLNVSGNSTTSYLFVKDSNACGSNGGGLTTASSTGGGNNTCWSGLDELVTVNATTTLTNHTDTQVNNAFNFQNQTNEPLFAFRMEELNATSTITELVLTLSGVKDVDDTDFSNIKLWRDLDNDAEYDATDTELSTGVMTIEGGTGTITFSTTFTSSTTANYLVTAGWNYPANSSSMNINLYGEDITATDDSGTHDFIGEVRRAQHSRLATRSGGGGSSAAVGSPAPEGDGEVSGGTNDGGELIGNDPDFLAPTANSGSWTNPENAYDNTDGTYASAPSAITNNFQDHSFVINPTNTVEGIEVKLEVSADTPGGDIDAELSYDGGTSWTSAKTTPTLTTTDTVVTLGGPADTWGRAWTPGEFSNANFRVRLTAAPSSDNGRPNTIQVDAIQVKVFHQATGGGGGGGGRI